MQEPAAMHSPKSPKKCSPRKTYQEPICLICGQKGGDLIYVHGKDYIVSASGTPLSDFLTKVVREEPCYSVSEVICQQCYILLDRLDAYQMRAAEILCYLTTRYKETKVELLGYRQRMVELIAASLSNIDRLQSGTSMKVCDELTITVFHDGKPERKLPDLPENLMRCHHYPNAKKPLKQQSPASDQKSSPSMTIRKKRKLDFSLSHFANHVLHRDDHKMNHYCTESTNRVVSPSDEGLSDVGYSVCQKKSVSTPDSHSQSAKSIPEHLPYEQRTVNGDVMKCLTRSVEEGFDAKDDSSSSNSLSSDSENSSSSSSSESSGSGSTSSTVTSSSGSSSEGSDGECLPDRRPKVRTEPVPTKEAVTRRKPSSETRTRTSGCSLAEATLHKTPPEERVNGCKSVGESSPSRRVHANPSDNSREDHPSCDPPGVHSAVGKLHTEKEEKCDAQDIHLHGTSDSSKQFVDGKMEGSLLVANHLASSILQSFLSTSLWFGPTDVNGRKEDSEPDDHKDASSDGHMEDLTSEMLTVVAGSGKDKKRRQELKNTGQSYINTKGKLVEAKRVWPQDCSRCHFKCNQRISEDDRQRIFAEYWGLADYNLQREYLASNMKRKEVVGPSGLVRTIVLYYLTYNSEKMRVCRQFFLKTLDVSEKVSRIVLEKKVKGELKEKDCWKRPRKQKKS